MITKGSSYLIYLRHCTIAELYWDTRGVSTLKSEAQRLLEGYKVITPKEFDLWKE
jgi:light-regulated signal transduction histidine kinase (bacteriophytochrome)